MKVKVLHTISTIISKDYTTTFNSTKHLIEHIIEPNGYLIDKITFVPYHNIRELVVEVEPLKATALTLKEVLEAVELPEDEAEQTVHESTGIIKKHKAKQVK
jgi:hypothetical protein